MREGVDQRAADNQFHIVGDSAKPGSERLRVFHHGGHSRAQNYAAYCLEDWIAPRRVARVTKTGSLPSPSSDDLSMSDDRCLRYGEVKRASR